MSDSVKVNILFLAAQPEDQGGVTFDREHDRIDEQIRKSKYRDFVELKPCLSTTIDKLLPAMNAICPTCVHFSGHGNEWKELLLVDTNGNSRPIDLELLNRMFENAGHRVPVVLLNGCFTADLAKSLVSAKNRQKNVDFAIGMSNKIRNDAAEAFAARFYSALCDGKSVQVAFEQAKIAIDEIEVVGSKFPQLYARKGMVAGEAYLVSEEVRNSISFVSTGTNEPKAGMASTRVKFEPAFDSNVSLPSNYVRREQFDQALAELTNFCSNHPVGLTSTFEGPGGFGKTTLSYDIIGDSVIRERFPGRAWVTLGQNANSTLNVSHLISQVTGHDPTSSGIMNQKKELKASIEEFERPVLIVIDDAWKPDDIEPLVVEAPNVRYLLTTRNRECLEHFESRSIQVGDVSAVEAKAILLGKLKIPESMDAETQARIERLATKNLGRWPILLNLAHARLQKLMLNGTTFETAIVEVERVLENRGITGFDDLRKSGMSLANARTRSIHACIQASLDEIPRSTADRYFELAIFPEDVSIPTSTLAALWGVDELQAREIALELSDISLLQFVGEAGRSSPHAPVFLVRLHDVFHAFLAGSLDAIRERELHSRLIDRWGDPVRLPDEYAWRHYRHHLARAGRTYEFSSLLCDYGWIREKLNAVGLSALLDDYREMPPDSARDIRLVGRALEQSSHVIGTDPDRMRCQLYGRLLGCEEGRITSMLESMSRSNEGLWLQPLRPSLVSARSPLMRTFAFHKGVKFILKVPKNSLKPESSRLVVGLDDGCIVVFDPNGVASDQILGRGTSGHTSAVSCMGFLPDGRLVSGSWDQTAMIWDLNAPENPIAVFKGHSNAISCFDIDSKTGYLATGGYDNTVKVWDPAAPEQAIATLFCPESHPNNFGKNRISGLRFYPITGSLVVASTDGSLVIWDSNDFDSPVQVVPEEDTIHCIIQDHRSGRWETACLKEPDVYVYDLGTKPNSQNQKHALRIPVASNICHILRIDSAREAKLWNLAFNERSRYVFRDFNLHINCFGFDSEHGLLFTGSSDNLVSVWDIAAPSEPIATLRGHDQSVNDLVFDSESSQLYTCSSDGTVRVWDLGNVKEIDSSRPTHDATLKAVAFVPNKDDLISFGHDNTSKLWNLRDLRNPKAILRGHYLGVKCFDFDPRTGNLVTGGYDRVVMVWDLEKPESPETILQGHNKHIECLGFTPQTGKLVTGGSDGMVLIWNPSEAMYPIASANVDVSLPGFEQSSGDSESKCVNALSFAPDGKRFFTAGTDKVVRAWTSEEPISLVRQFIGHSDGVTCLAYDEKSGRLISGSWDCTIRIWNPEDSGESLVTMHSAQGESGHISPSNDVESCLILRGHRGRITGLKFHPETWRLVSSSIDGTIRTWDLSKPDETPYVLTAHDDAIDQFDFLSDGRLVTCSHDRTLKVWRSNGSDPTHGMIGPEVVYHADAGIVSLAIAEFDGKSILAAGDLNGNLHVLELAGEASKKRMPPG